MRFLPLILGLLLSSPFAFSFPIPVHKSACETVLNSQASYTESPAEKLELRALLDQIEEKSIKHSSPAVRKLISAYVSGFREGIDNSFQTVTLPPFFSDALQSMRSALQDSYDAAKTQSLPLEKEKAEYIEAVLESLNSAASSKERVSYSFGLRISYDYTVALSFARSWKGDPWHRDSKDIVGAAGAISGHEYHANFINSYIEAAPFFLAVPYWGDLSPADMVNSLFLPQTPAGLLSEPVGYDGTPASDRTANIFFNHDIYSHGPDYLLESWGSFFNGRTRGDMANGVAVRFVGKPKELLHEILRRLEFREKLNRVIAKESSVVQEVLYLTLFEIYHEGSSEKPAYEAKSLAHFVAPLKAKLVRNIFGRIRRPNDFVGESSTFSRLSDVQLNTALEIAVARLSSLI